MKRRQFTQTLALLAGGMAASAYAGIPASHKLLQMGATREEFSRKMFDTKIGSTFQLQYEGSHTLVLTGIEDVACQGHCEQFNLVFELGSGERLEEGIYTLECLDGSRMDLFLIPSERDVARPQLVSIFNLLPAT